MDNFNPAGKTMSLSRLDCHSSIEHKFIFFDLHSRRLFRLSVDRILERIFYTLLELWTGTGQHKDRRAVSNSIHLVSPSFTELHHG